ncbi:MAG: radical SAM protein [Candidatus Hodarchaeales archaeon]
MAGEKGTCLMDIPAVASCQIHPAPPQSYTIFTAGCNFRCLNCQNWEIAHYPSSNSKIEGPVAPELIAQAGVKAIRSYAGHLIGADRIFFSGGAPTVSLPWIEDVIHGAKSLDPDIKVNFDTNGFSSTESFRRILSFSDSITFDIKAFNDEVHRALTGAPVEPVLRNVQEMARHRNRLWDFRVLVIPSIIDLPEVQSISEFLADLDESLPVCFLAFRPNFCLDEHPGAPEKLMRDVVDNARKTGLENVKWAGFAGIPGTTCSFPQHFSDQFVYKNAAVAANLARKAGCQRVHRFCGTCDDKVSCKLKAYIPSRNT